MYYLCAVKQKTKNDEDSNFKNSRTDRQRESPKTAPLQLKRM